MCETGSFILRDCSPDKVKLNQSFFDFIATYRIREAEKILLDPDQNHLTVEEIAEEVGYISKSAFNKTFKRITGKTPSEYRA